MKNNYSGTHNCNTTVPVKDSQLGVPEWVSEGWRISEIVYIIRKRLSFRTDSSTYYSPGHIHSLAWVPIVQYTNHTTLWNSFEHWHIRIILRLSLLFLVQFPCLMRAVSGCLDVPICLLSELILTTQLFLAMSIGGRKWRLILSGKHPASCCVLWGKSFSTSTWKSTCILLWPLGEIIL